MAEITVTVCDMDQRPGDTVRHYTVTVDGMASEMDLCDRHAGPFAPIGHKSSAQSPARGRAKPSGAARRKTTTLAEIEASKTAAAKKK
jgi:hypothetical protein